WSGASFFNAAAAAVALSWSKPRLARAGSALPSMAFFQATFRMAKFKLKPWSCEKLFLASRAPRQLGAHLPTLPPKSVGKRSAACGAPAAAIGASGTLRSFHHGLAFGGAAAGPSDPAALRGRGGG